MATLTLGLVSAGHGSRGWGRGVYRGFGEYCAIVWSLLSPPPPLPAPRRLSWVLSSYSSGLTLEGCVVRVGTCPGVSMFTLAPETCSEYW